VANVNATRRVRLALGETQDVVMIDAVLIEYVPKASATEEVANAYAAQAGWDPRKEGDDYVYLVLRPERIQVWRESESLNERTIMLGGTWVT
jgi:hypothetical protein